MTSHIREAKETGEMSVADAIEAFLNGDEPEHYTYTVPDDPKMLRETLCVAQSRIGNSPLDQGRRGEHMARLQRLLDVCDLKRPLGPDGKHGDRHTPECGCDL